MNTWDGRRPGRGLEFHGRPAGRAILQNEGNMRKALMCVGMLLAAAGLKVQADGTMRPCEPACMTCSAGGTHKAHAEVENRFVRANCGSKQPEPDAASTDHVAK